MKTLNLAGLILGSVFWAGLDTNAAVSSGGERLIRGDIPTLSMTHTGGNIAPAFQYTACEIYNSKAVKKFRGSNFSERKLLEIKDMEFTDSIPDMTALERTIVSTLGGRLVSGPRANPDFGTTVYKANLISVARSGEPPGSGPWATPVILQIESIFGQINEAPHTSEILDLIKVNCE